MPKRPPPVSPGARYIPPPQGYGYTTPGDNNPKAQTIITGGAVYTVFFFEGPTRNKRGNTKAEPTHTSTHAISSTHVLRILDTCEGGGAPIFFSRFLTLVTLHDHLSPQKTDICDKLKLQPDELYPTAQVKKTPYWQRKKGLSDDFGLSPPPPVI